MDPAALEARLRADEVAPGAVRPRYDGYGFAGVPGAAVAALGVDPPRVGLGPPVPAEALADAAGVERVVVLVVDGFGWDQWRRDAADHAFLRRLADRGAVVPLTSTYPSETAACMTTFHVGAVPARHGLLGWDVYVPALDRVVQPMPFTTTDGEPLGPLADDAPDAELLLDGEAVYPALADAGVSTTVVQPADTVGSPYSRRVLAGADVTPYGDPDGLAAGIRRALEGGTTPQYVHAYVAAVDAAVHRAGTRSTAHREALEALSAALEASLADLNPAVAAETLFVLTADHGAVDVDPADVVDLFALDGVRERLRRRPGGSPVPPTGGPRNVHLHVAPGEVEALAARLEAVLDAHVFRTADAVAAGLFGDAEPSALFEERAGDLLVVPRAGSVWHGDDASKFAFVGMHGGLDPREALVPLASARLDALGA